MLHNSVQFGIVWPPSESASVKTCMASSKSTRGSNDDGFPRAASQMGTSRSPPSERAYRSSSVNSDRPGALSMSIAGACRTRTRATLSGITQFLLIGVCLRVGVLVCWGVLVCRCVLDYLLRSRQPKLNHELEGRVLHVQLT